MNNNQYSARLWPLGGLWTIVALATLSQAALGAAEQVVSTTIPVGAYEITETDKGHKIVMEGFGFLNVPGNPRLPSKIFAVAIPPGAQVVEVRFDAGQGIDVPGEYRVIPSAPPGVIDGKRTEYLPQALEQYEENLSTVYGSNDVCPANVVELVRTAGYRKYNLVDVRVTPFAFRPLSGELTYFPDITVHVHYALPEEPADVMVDNIEKPERTARRIVLNYVQASDWYAGESTRDGGLHDFVIITLDSLTSSVAPLVDWETQKGRTVEVVTTSWIASNYTGYDLAEKMRNFLRATYPSGVWGIEDVLLVGDYDDVPMRRTAQDVGYGQPETDFYFAELSLPDSESWDADGDHQYGEAGDPIDFYAEVNVGRIPWSSPSTVQSICEKSVAYEQNSDPSFKKNILLLGAYFWADTDNAVLMEVKVDQPWMSDWTMTRMYEKNSGYYSTYDCDYPLLHENVMDVWPDGHFAFVNWAGHGSPTSCHIYGLGAPAFISNSDCPALDDDHPAIIFADACSNSDTDDLNIGKAMLQQGAVGFVGATKVALGHHGWSAPYDGSSQSLDYFFTTCVTSGEYTQGEALSWALTEMYVNGLWNYDKYETFEWGALWGNPDLGMRAPVLRISFPNGVPELLPPGEPVDIAVEVIPGGEQYTPGSATLHYRYDGGEYQASPLTHISGDLFEGTLPAAACNDTPEFYFSAEGSISGVTYEPPSGPSQTPFIAGVGELVIIMHDDFETDMGWSVEDINLQDGSWERGTPIGGGARGDPHTDSDGSGQCYLTANRLGDSDVDGGPTCLISPLLDLGGTSDPMVRYARWFTNDDLDNDRMDVEITNDDGDSWVLIESALDSQGWVERTVRIVNFVEPTSQVRIRFCAADLPNNSIDEAGVDDFWVTRLECAGPGNGDFDSDGDVDLADFASFQACFSGISAGGCEPGDMNGDSSVNLDDFAQFALALVGPQ